MVSTLVCAVADTVIANANGSESDSWYTSALEEPSFQRKVSAQSLLPTNTIDNTPDKTKPNHFGTHTLQNSS